MKDKTFLIIQILAWLVILSSVGYQVLDYFLFRHAGKRFTASDGQELCLRVQVIDGKPCSYNH